MDLMDLVGSLSPQKPLPGILGHFPALQDPLGYQVGHRVPQPLHDPLSPGQGWIKATILPTVKINRATMDGYSFEE